jgi:hypothetical protein
VNKKAAQKSNATNSTLQPPLAVPIPPEIVKHKEQENEDREKG